MDEYAFEYDFASNIRFLTDDEKNEFQSILSMEMWKYCTITHSDTNVINDYCRTKIGGWMGYSYCSRFSQAPECPDCGDKMDINFLHENGYWFGLNRIEIDVYLCSKCSKFEVQV